MKYYTESRRRGKSCIQGKEERLTGLVTSLLKLPSKTRDEGKLEGRIEMTGRRGIQCK
jgi:hypothetical protein